MINELDMIDLKTQYIQGSMKNYHSKAGIYQEKLESIIIYDKVVEKQVVVDGEGI